MAKPGIHSSRNKAGLGEAGESKRSERPRILFVSHSGDLYGAERSLLTLLRGLLKTGKYELMVFAPHEGALTKTLGDEGIAFRVLPFARWIGLRYHFITRYARRLKNRWYLPALIRAAEQWNPDIIYTNTIATPVGAIMAGKLSARPCHIWHARELPGNKELGFGLFDMGSHSSYRLIAQTADRLICNSQFLYNKLKALLEDESGNGGKSGSNPEMPMEVILNGFEITKHQPEDREGHRDKRSEGHSDEHSEGHSDEHSEGHSEERSFERSSGKTIRLIMAGGISPVKNYEEAIEGIRRLSDTGYSVNLDIYGSGSPCYLKKVKNQVSGAKLDHRVRFMGYTDDISSELARADMLLITSRMETFGRTAVEAMLAGCPVISSDSGALPEIIKDGETGLLYRSGDAEHLSFQIRKLTDSPALRSEMAKKAAEYACRNFSVERFTSDIDRILQQLLSSKDCGSE